MISKFSGGFHIAMSLRRGEWAEKVALQFYLSKGYQLIAKNLKSYGGEIDLVFKKNKKIILVEVRQRRSSLVNALLTVGDGKKHRILRTWYQKSEKYAMYPLEMEICIVIGSPDDYTVTIFREEL